MLIALLAVFHGLLFFIPPQVTVSAGGIRYTHGQHGWGVKLGDLEFPRLVIFSPTFAQLQFRYRGRKRRIMIPESVDRHELRQLLPEPLPGRDVSRRLELVRQRMILYPSPEKA